MCTPNLLGLGQSANSHIGGEYIRDLSGCGKVLM
jgi:hypothetical protein